MKSVIIYFKDLTTGKTREEIWKQIDNTKNYIAPDGYIYTKGCLGWFCLNPNK
jgi:hypothetical protein